MDFSTALKAFKSGKSVRNGSTEYALHGDQICRVLDEHNSIPVELTTAELLSEDWQETGEKKGFLSRMADKVSGSKKAEKPVVDYTSFLKAELIAQCEERGLDASGNKDDLIARLVNDDNGK